jgi:O-succinylbenzoate synthase
VTIADARLYRYRLPLTEALPVGDRTLTERCGLLLCVTGEAGEEGWGEVAPLPGFSPETLEEATAQARRVRAVLPGLGVPEADLDAALRAVPAENWSSSVRFAAESAVVELIAAVRRTTVARVLGGHTGTVAMNALIPSSEVDLDAAADRIRRAGYRAVKLKVGRADIETDARRVRQLHGGLGGDVALRLDANRKWTREEAVAFAEALGGVPIEYVEEPLSTPTDLPSFANRTGLPVALDETTRERSPEEVPADLPVRAVVLKPALLGGIANTRRWAEWARHRNAEPVISASYESGVGLRMLVALAASFSEAPAGLSTYDRLTADVLRPRLPLAGADVEVARVGRSTVDRGALEMLAPAR